MQDVNEHLKCDLSVNTKGNRVHCQINKMQRYILQMHLLFGFNTIKL